MNKIIIKKNDNPKMNILPILKSLYMERSEINSLGKVLEFKKTFDDTDHVSINVIDKALDIFLGYFLTLN